MVEVSEFTFPSVDNGAPMHAMIWENDENAAPRGIIQIVHGMSEYVGRYDHLARFLVDQGFVVCGEDHVGHGQSAATPEDWGCLPAKNGVETLVGNVDALRTLMTERFANVPYFLYGHSMGSFITRAYLTRHGQGLAGVVLSGTGNQPAMVAKGGLMLAKAIAKNKGERYRSKTLNAMADGAYAKAIKNARTPFDWLSTDPAVVDAYIADPACGFMFAAGGYVTLMGLLADIANLKRLKNIPADLPIFLVAGADDPVGDMGRGVTQVYKDYREAGLKNTTMRLYLGMRHEIHNEVDKEKVYNDLLAWLEAQC